MYSKLFSQMFVCLCALCMSRAEPSKPLFILMDALFEQTVNLFGNINRTTILWLSKNVTIQLETATTQQRIFHSFDISSKFSLA